MGECQTGPVSRAILERLFMWIGDCYGVKAGIGNFLGAKLGQECPSHTQVVVFTDGLWGLQLDDRAEAAELRPVLLPAEAVARAQEPVPDPSSLRNVASSRCAGFRALRQHLFRSLWGE